MFKKDYSQPLQLGIANELHDYLRMPSFSINAR